MATQNRRKTIRSSITSSYPDLFSASVTCSNSASGSMRVTIVKETAAEKYH